MNSKEQLFCLETHENRNATNAFKLNCSQIHVQINLETDMIEVHRLKASLMDVFVCGIESRFNNHDEHIQHAAGIANKNK